LLEKSPANLIFFYLRIVASDLGPIIITSSARWKINQDFDVVTATTDEEIKKCGALEYQKYDERTVGATHISYYRRPERFGSAKV